MLCELCNKNPATVHFKQVCDGEVKERYVCEECAAKSGFNVQVPLNMAEFLFGIGMKPASVPAAEDKACKSCHMRGGDFKKTSRLGCPKCYTTFSDELAPMLAAMHKGTRHVGKTPARLRAGRELADLRADLQAAVREQRFEDAASLRDRIRDAESRTAAG